jgi:hypothetical protein
MKGRNRWSLLRSKISLFSFAAKDIKLIWLSNNFSLSVRDEGYSRQYININSIRPMAKQNVSFVRKDF